MKYCSRCKVAIENDLDSCPLCKQAIVKSKGIPERDFPSNDKLKSDINNIIIRLLIFIFIILIGVNTILNLVYSFSFIWAPYSIVILFYAYLMLKLALSSYINIGTIIVINVYMLSVIGFILDIILGFSGWSLAYLMPILVLAGIISLTIFIIINPKSFINYIIYMLTITFFGIIQVVVLLSGIIEFTIICVISIFISIMAIIGMFMFGDKKTRNEFIKRFHF